MPCHHGRMGPCRRCPTTLFVLVLATGSLPAAALAQRPSFGPLTSEEGSPLQRISYTPMMEDADVTARGTFATDVWLGFSNIFEQDSSATHLLFLDMDRLISTVTVRWGAAERLEIGGRLTLETTGPGSLDSFILAWHNLFGFGNANRDRFPEDVYRQRLTKGGRETFLDIPRRTLGFGDARFFAKWRAVRSADERSVLAFRAVTLIPGNANLAGNRRADVAIMALGRLGVGAWYAHALVGGSTVRASPELEPILRDASFFLTLALERSLGRSVAALVQFQTQSAVLESFNHREIDRAPTNLVLGLAGRWGESWRWDASFQEDVPSDTPAIDFTVGLRISRTW
jgi:uncharacterized protein DUF3187